MFLKMTKKITIYLFLLCSTGIFAQDEAMIGSESDTKTSINVPVDLGYTMSWTSTIYTKGEINTGGVSQAGKINALSFYVTNNPNSCPKGKPFKIYIRETNETEFVSHGYGTAPPMPSGADLVKVYDGAVQWKKGWNTISLSQSFSFTNTKNIEIFVKDDVNDGGCNPYSSNNNPTFKAKKWTNPSSCSSSYCTSRTNYGYTNSGSSINTAGNTVSNRPIIKINFTSESSRSHRNSSSSSSGCSGGSGGPATVNIGNTTATGTSGNAPFNLGKPRYWTSTLYPQSDINQDGEIEAISFYVTNATNCTRNINVYMKITKDGNDPKVSNGLHVRDTWSSSNIPSIGGYTEVFSGSHTFQQGWNKITLDTKFLYSNNTGAHLEIYTQDFTSGSGCNVTFKTETKGDGSTKYPTRYKGADAVWNYDTTLKYHAKFTDQRPILKLNFASTGGGSAVPVEVTIANTNCGNGTVSAFPVPVQYGNTTTPNIQTWSVTHYKASDGSLGTNTGKNLTQINYHTDCNRANKTYQPATNQKIYIKEVANGASEISNSSYPDLSTYTLVFEGSLIWKIVNGNKEDSSVKIEFNKNGNSFAYNGGDLLVYFENKHNGVVEGSGYATTVPISGKSRKGSDNRVKYKKFTNTFNTTDGASGREPSLPMTKFIFKTPSTTTPLIVTNPTGATYNVGDTTRGLRIVGQNIKSYQWYSNDTNSNTGGTAITGATSAIYNPPTTTGNTKYYYVVITGCDGTTIVSQPAEVIVKPLTLTALQKNAGKIIPLGTEKVELISLNVNVKVNSGVEKKMDWFVFDYGKITAGTDNESDLSDFELYYGNSADFSLASKVTGASFDNSNPVYALFSNIDKKLKKGDNYFFVVFKATNNTNAGGHKIDAKFKQIRLSSDTYNNGVPGYGITDSTSGNLTLETPIKITLPASTSIICADKKYIFSGVTVNPTSATLQWTSANGGIFNNVASLNPTYTPSTAEVTAGTANLTLTATKNGVSKSENFTLTITKKTAITTQPKASNYCKEAVATALNVVAEGTGTVTYKWYSNDTKDTTTPTQVGTSQSYTPKTTTVGDTYYYAVVSSDCGAVITSDIVKVSVTKNTAITKQPKAKSSYCKGGIATALNVVAEGTGTVTYKWYSNDTKDTTTPTQVGTSQKYTPSTTTVGDTYYYAVVSSACGTAITSDIVKVSVIAKPNAGKGGILTVCEGSSTPTDIALFAQLTGADIGGTWTKPRTLAGNYIYTVNATSPCTAAATSKVVVKIQERPKAGKNGVLELCEGSAVPTDAALFAQLRGADIGGIWTKPSTLAGDYIYTVNAKGPCMIPATSKVVVTVVAKPKAGAATLEVLKGTKPSEEMLLKALGSDAESGTWSKTKGGYIYKTKTGSPCNATISSIVTIVEKEEMINAFSPNGDEINDVWRIIPDIEKRYPNNRLVVFNRHGNKVYESKPYRNDWGGISNGVAVTNNTMKIPPGPYYYVLELNDTEETVFKGWVYINY